MAMARPSPCLAVSIVWLLLTAASAERIWTICKGTVPRTPSSEEMSLDVEVGSELRCSAEYTFKELCDVDFNIMLDDELSQEGSMFLAAANRQPSSPDGSMAGNAACSVGSQCYMMCTSGSEVMELAEESSDPPSAFLVGVSRANVSKSTGTSEQITTSCNPGYLTKQEMLDGAIFNFRKKFLIAQGLDANSDQLKCEYTGTDPRYTKTVSSSLSQQVQKGVSRGLRGAGVLASCISLAALTKMPVQEILQKFPTIGFMINDPTAQTQAHLGRAWKKFPVHHIYWDETSQVLSLVSYMKQKLDIDAETGNATLTYASPSHRKDSLVGADVCIQNVPRQRQPRGTTTDESVALSQQERQGCKGSKCGVNSFAGALMTSGSFTMMR